MATSVPDLQQELALSSTPAAEFQHLDHGRKRELFFQLPESLQQSLISDLSDDRLHQFVRRLDPDEATDVLGVAEPERREGVIQRLDEDRREKVSFLLDFSPESAAGLMHLDYVTVQADQTFEQVGTRVRRHEDRTGRLPRIFVLDGDTILGELPGQTRDDRQGVGIGHRLRSRDADGQLRYPPGVGRRDSPIEPRENSRSSRRRRGDPRCDLR